MGKTSLRVVSLSVALAFQGVVAAEAMGWSKCELHSELPQSVSEAPSQRAAHGFDNDNEAQTDHHDSGPCSCLGSSDLESNSSDGLTHEYASKEPMLFSRATGNIHRADGEALPTPPSYLLPYSQAPPSSA